MPENGTDPSRGVAGLVATGRPVDPEDAVVGAGAVVRGIDPSVGTPPSAGAGPTATPAG